MLTSNVHSRGLHCQYAREANWRVGPISSSSRDNLPDPVASRDDPYVPRNSPAIGDLMDMFRFDRDDGHHERR
ncbi:MAG TPA: hypothetical protein VFN79_09325 [Steroidobacteraceae bacterium]|nr:hypothetical protein [Steroidobacteraceae bacterium]